MHLDVHLGMHLGMHLGVHLGRARACSRGTEGGSGSSETRCFSEEATQSAPGQGWG